MTRDEASRVLHSAVQDPQHGPRQISQLANAGFDLNDSTYPQHPVFLAMGLQHMNIVNVLIDHGVRFDHRDSTHYNVSVIQQLRSLRELFQELAASPDHKETRGILKRRLKSTQQAIEKYEALVASGAIEEIEDSPLPTPAELADQIEQTWQDFPAVGNALRDVIQKLREGS